MKSKDFLKDLAALSATLRANIEAHYAGWDDSASAITARIKAVNDPVGGFEYFVANYFPHYVRHPDKSDLHRYLFERLPRILASPGSELDAIAAPRGEAKSTIVTQLYTLYCIITGRKRYILLVMESIDQAYPMLEAIKTELGANPRLAIDFPQVAGGGRVWQAGTIVTGNNIKVQVAGSGKKLRGLRHGAYRPDLVILDDLENDEQVLSPTQRDKLHGWLKRTVLPLGAAGEKMDVVYIGTILHYDSVLARTLANSGWTTARFRAVIRWPDNMALWDEWEARWQTDRDAADRYYTEHQAEMDKGAVVSWSARPILELMKLRARDGHAAFDSEYQNDPVSGEDAPFANALQFWGALPPDLLWFGAVDPSLGRLGASRDPSAILVGGYERATGKLYVAEAQITKRLPDRIIEDVIALHQRYRCQVWFVEAVQFQEFLRTELIKRSAARGIPVPARAVTPHSDKALRIESLQPHLANGLILLHQEQATLIDQLRHYPKADHDDGPDALHMLWAGAVASGGSGQGLRPVEIPEPTL